MMLTIINKPQDTLSPGGPDTCNVMNNPSTPSEQQSTWSGLLYYLNMVYYIFLIINVLQAHYRIFGKYERGKNCKLLNATTRVNEPWLPSWRISFRAIRGINTEVVQVTVLMIYFLLFSLTILL